MGRSRETPSVVDFWLGVAFGVTALASFLVGAFTKGSLQWVAQ